MRRHGLRNQCLPTRQVRRFDVRLSMDRKQRPVLSLDGLSMYNVHIVGCRP